MKKENIPQDYATALQVIDISPVALVIIRVSDGKVMFYNPAAAELFKLEKNGTYFSGDFFLDRQASRQLADKLKKVIYMERTELALVKTDHTTFDAAVSSRIAKYKGEDAIFSGIVNISEQKAAEKNRLQLIQADKMISLGVLVAGVAHEINNPTNFIMLNAPILQEAWKSILPVLDAYYREFGDFSVAGLSYEEMREIAPSLFDGIIHGAERIKNIVKGLKDYSRQDSSQLDEVVNINEVVYNSLGLLKNMISKSTRHFTVDYQKPLPPVRGNPQRIEQVVINVVQNACQALPSPDRGLSISTGFRLKPETVIITVTDGGVGISEENLTQVTDPFFTTKLDSGGTGLGLAISSGIINDMNGTLEIDSVKGKGTTVRILLPAIKNDKQVEIPVNDGNN